MLNFLRTRKPSSKTEDDYLEELQEIADALGWETSPIMDEEGGLHGVLMNDAEVATEDETTMEWEVQEHAAQGGIAIVVVRSDGEDCHAKFYQYK